MGKEDNKTKCFVLRIDGRTMEAIEKWAADEFRSINGQIQWLIDDALRRNGRLPARNRPPEATQANIKASSPGEKHI